jgi:predicted nucleic acid-binding protein
LIEQTPTLVDRAADLAEAHALRAYDAVQLAAALEIDANVKSAGVSMITLVSADGGLNAAAITEGLAVDDPNTHP